MCLEFMVMKTCECNIDFLQPRAGVFPACSSWEREHLLSCKMRKTSNLWDIFCLELVVLDLLSPKEVSSQRQ